MVKIVGEEKINNSKNNIVLNPLLIDLYDVKTEKKIPTIAVKNGARRGTSSSLTISIGDMLKSVKDYNGVDYVDANGVGNFYPPLSDDITKTEAFKEWFKGSKVVDENGNPLVLYQLKPPRLSGPSSTKSRLIHCTTDAHAEHHWRARILTAFFYNV